MQSIFKPLFEELDQIEEPLDREEFLDASLRLYNVSKFDYFTINLYSFQTLNQNQKNMILKFGKVKNQSEADYQLQKCTFKPVTNKDYNMNIANKLNQSSLGGPPQVTNAILQRPQSVNKLTSQGSKGGLFDKVLGDNRKPVFNQDLAAFVSQPVTTQTSIMKSKMSPKMQKTG